MVDMFSTIGVGQWFRYVTGLIEVGSAILLFVPSLAIVGAILLICTMVGAIIAHFTVLHTPPTMPVVLLALSAIIAWLRRPTAMPARV
jgi:putative oxidoreductase